MSDVWSEVYSEPPKPDMGFDPEPPSLASTDTEFGTVLASLDGGRNVLVRTEGGRELFVQNTLFRQVRRGDRIAAFFTSEGWSVVSPRWSAWSPVSVAHEIGRPLGDLLRAAHALWPSMGESEPQVLDTDQLHQLLSILEVTPSTFENRLAKARLTFGSIVSFRIDSVKEDDSMWLIGHIGELEVPAVLHRQSLGFPRCLMNFPAGRLVDKSLKVFVADVGQRPICVARHVHEREFFSRQSKIWDASILLPTDLPEHFLHIDALSCHWHQLEATVVAVKEGHCWLGILGINRIFLPQEEYSWNAEASPPRIGQRIRVKVLADRDELRLWASARVLDRDCWEAVKRDVPIGTVWSRAHRCRTGALGAVYETVFGNLRLQGWAPLAMAKNALEGFQTTDFEADERDVQVVGYDENHCHFKLGHAFGVTETYRARVGDLLPVLVLWKEEDSATVQWSPVHPPIRVPSTEGCESTGGKALVARVETTDEEGTPISLTLLPSVANWEVVKAESEFVHLRSVATGAALKISHSDTLGEFQVGDTIWLSWSKTSFGDHGPTITGFRCGAPDQFTVGAIVTGRSREAVKGGLLVDVNGVECFLPATQIDTTPQNPAAWVDQAIRCIIIKAAPGRPTVISRKELIEQELIPQRAALLATLQVGARMRGIVKNITDFGAFLDLGGLVGLLHLTQMSWGELAHPSELVEIGEELEVIILEVDKEKERVSLSLKQDRENPWREIEKRLPIGTKIKGKVTRFTPSGAFVEFGEIVQGFLPVQELSWIKRIARPSDVLTVGEEVEAVVLKVDEKDRRISLGARQLQPNPWDEMDRKYPIGKTVKGTVRNMTAYGAFVELEEGVDGMVHVSDISWTRKINHPSEILAKGAEVTAVVMSIDKALCRISLSIKNLEPDPWANIEQYYKVGQRVTGKVSKFAAFAAFVEMGGGIAGLVHVSQISEDPVKNVKDVLSLEQEIEARVVKVDLARRRIGLSIKAANYSEDRFFEEVERLSKMDVTILVGDRVKGKVNKIASKGVFVELDCGIEGHADISQISEGRIEKIEDILEVGQEIEARVVKVDTAGGPIVLSIKAANYSDDQFFKELQRLSEVPDIGKLCLPASETKLPTPPELSQRKHAPKETLHTWEIKKVDYPIGKKVKGIVLGLNADYARIKLGEDVIGRVYLKDMSWARKLTHPSEILQRGDEFEAVVIRIQNHDRRIILGIKQLEDDPWKDIEQRFKRGDEVRGKVSRIAAIGAFVELEGGFAGLIHISQISEEGINEVTDFLKVGQEVEARIVNFDTATRQIGLSLLGVMTLAPLSAISMQNSLVSQEQSVESDSDASNALGLQKKSPESHRPLKITTQGISEPYVTFEAVGDFEAWLHGAKAGDLEDRLRDARLPTIASLVAFAEGRRLERPPLVSTWRRLGALLREGGDCESDLHAHLQEAECFERILLALASYPGEIALYAALFRLLPAQFLRDRGKMLHDWLLHLRPDRELDWRLGIALLRAWAAERAGEPGIAFTHLNELTTEVSDPALRRMLVGWVSQQEDLLKNRSRHYGEYTRIFGDPVRTGGFAHVIPVRSGAGDRYALKHIRLRPLTPDEIRSVTDLFRHEASILARVRHENIVHFERELGEGAILLEWLPGRPLRGRGDVSNRGDEIDGLGNSAGWWNSPRIVDLGRRVALAMAELERVFGSFVHNDLTPRNLMIDQARGAAGDSAWVKLIDFGLACSPQFFSISTVIDEAGVRLREPYRAPEAQRGVFNNPGSDMYSLGVILFQLITRRYPRLNVTPQLDWEIDAVAPESLRSAIPSDFSTLILRLLARQPEARPRTWKEVVSSLDALRPSSASR